MVAGLLALIFIPQHSSYGLTFDVDNLVPVWTDSAEPRSTWYLDSEEEWEHNRGANNDADKLGLLLTGISEFPWIVDIRVDTVDEERWSTGNLVSFWNVLTTCRAAHLLEDDDSRLNGSGMKVTFSKQYLWEYQDRLKIFPDEEQYDYGGSRISEQVIRHPKCNVLQNVWDVAILKLSYGIQPATPIIGYIPVVQNYSDGSIPNDVDLSQMEKQRLVCFVASIGRNYLNSRDNFVVDFKVKHRVYWEDFNECVRMVPRMCKVGFTSGDCGPRTLADPDSDGKHWMCFRTRAKVGTVCDHDRGAPLVCDGEVYGIVVMGALREYCNSVLPVQFVVAKITQHRDYFQKFIAKDQRRRDWNSHSRAIPSSSFYGISSVLTANLIFQYFQK